MRVVNVMWFGGVERFKRIYEVGGCGVYVGRGSVLGNRFKIGVDGDREEVIKMYRRWLWEKVKSGDEVVIGELKKIKEGWLIGCFCKKWDVEVKCHGDVIVKCVRWMG